MPLGWLLPALIAVSSVVWAWSRTRQRGYITPLFISLLAYALWKGFGQGSPRVVDASMALAAIATLHLLLLLITPVLERNRIPRLISEIALAGGYVTVLFVLLSRQGVNLTGLITTSAVATAAIGLSLQDTLSNLASGITLQIENTVRVGDWLRTAAGVGRVTAMRMRHTVLETPYGDRILLPNQTITRDSIAVLARDQRHQIPFRVQYGPAPDTVVRAVTEALRGSAIAYVSVHPGPECLLTAFHADHIEYALVFYTSLPSTEPWAASEVMARAFCALSRIGAEMKGVTQTVKLVRKDKTQMEPARKQGLDMLREMDVFQSLEQSEIEMLAGSLRRLPYGAGEVIIRQGDSGDSLYLIQSGHVRVLVSQNGVGPEQIATLSSGDFFGEMSLFTGEARSATVVAGENAICLQLAKADLLPLMQQRPSVTRDISEVLATRKSELESLRERMNSDSALPDDWDTQKGLLRKIQRFFGISFKTAS